MPTDRHDRPLSDHERELARWMLEHGATDAKRYLPQLDRATASVKRCPCGCASFHFLIDGLPKAPPGVHILGEFFFGVEDDPKDFFIYESAGILSGVEVFGLSGDNPALLPRVADLRPAVFGRFPPPPK